MTKKSSISEGREPVHPIQVVSQRTGLTPDVLRVWERRYGAVRPSRSETGRRLYSDHDVEHLLLLRRATLAGRNIGQVAQLKTKELRRLVETDEAALARVPRGAEPGFGARSRQSDGEAGAYLDQAVTSVRNLDTESLEKALSLATLDLTPAAVVDDVVVPLMNEIGRLWEGGELRVVHEHMTSAVVRTFLGNHTARGSLPESAPLILAGTPAGQLHELGALVVVGVAATAGWRSIYLGPNLPAEEFASAARQKGARVIALSLLYPSDDSGVVTELRRLRKLAPAETDIVVGGPAASGYRTVVEEIGAHRLDDLDGLRAVLDGLRLKGAFS